ncbi:hypothetical protein EG327_000579 [Venturia inaequalis]|uniref:Uncharacterized protein n=1 Tax=Venturia inaequalis TaxID=5025 RepID=A0A8H3VLI7_VENIN|nr:hypothetical protein EG327_000579 [Venturia inaequalis]
MHIPTPFITAALAVSVSAHPTKEALTSQICRRDTKIWSFENVPMTSSLHTRRALPPDNFFGTPKSIPAVFKGTAEVGPPEGGKVFQESAHFRVYDAQSTTQATKTLAMMEAAYDCFVNDMKFRTSGLSFNAESDEGYTGPFYKENIYGKASMPGAAGVMNTNMTLGMSYVQVLADFLDDPTITVHEFGHALTYHEKGWVNQGNTGVFWEPIAEWFADTYITSDLCAAARARGKQPKGDTIIDLDRIISGSPAVIVDGTTPAPNNNYYQSWPFFAYITNNPDEIEGLGKFAVRNLFRAFKAGSQETPLHTIAYITTTPVREIVAKYWARMAFVDIGHDIAAALYKDLRKRFNYANLDAVGSTGTYKPKVGRMPKYFGANIIPLKATGKTIGVEITAQKAFIATLVVKKGTVVSYVSCPGGACTAPVGDEAMLVIVNAPEELMKYDGFAISRAANEGLNYELKLTGAKAKAKA